MLANLDQLQSADNGQGEQHSPTFSDISSDRQTRLLFREQSFARVAAENQHAKIEPFQAWAVDTGQWGGRELTPEDPDPLKSLPSVAEVSLQDWMAAAETEQFTMHPPASLHRRGRFEVPTDLLQERPRGERLLIDWRGARAAKQFTSFYFAAPCVIELARSHTALCNQYSAAERTCGSDGM